MPNGRRLADNVLVQKSPGLIADMFDRIAPRYDFLNRLLSLRQDVRWRKKMKAYLPEKRHALLDLATGTGDVLTVLAGEFERATGMDISPKMLDIAKTKVVATFKLGDATAIPEAENSFDAVTMAFGIRNVENVAKALAEIRRVMTPSGRLIILEFSMPKNGALRGVYLLYFRKFLPAIGGLFSGDKKAYSYLNASVEKFPCGETFCEEMRNAGFRNVFAKSLTFGVATIYCGDKL